MFSKVDLWRAGLLLFTICAAIGHHDDAVGAIKGLREFRAGEIIKAHESACNAITSFDLYVKTSSYLLLEPVRHGPRNAGTESSRMKQWKRVEPGKEEKVGPRVSRQLMLGEKFRIDLLKAGGVEVLKGRNSAWNGATFKQLHSARRLGIVSAYAKTLGGDLGIAYTSLYRNFDGELTYADFIRSRKTVTLERHGQLVLLSARPEPGAQVRANSFGVNLLLDPDKGFMPVRIELTVAGSDLPQSVYDNELGQVQPGIWAPIKSRVGIPMPYESEFHGQEAAYKLVEVDMGRSRFNISLDDSVFEIRFPPGFEVQDRIRNMSYRIGAESQQGYLDHLADLGRLSLEQLQKDRPPVQRLQVVPGRSRVLIWLNLGLLGGVVLCLAAYWWRKRWAVVS